MREVEDLRYLKARLDAILSLAPPPPPSDLDPGDIATGDVEALRRELDEEAPLLEAMLHRLDELTHEVEIIPRYVSSLRRLLPLVPEMTDLVGYDMTALLIDSRYADVLGELNASLTEVLGANYEVISDRVDPDTLGAVLVFPKARAADVRSLVGREQLTQLQLPQRFRGIPFRQAIVAMEQRLTEIPAELAAVQEEIHRFVESHRDWVAYREYLADRLEQLAAFRHLGATLHTFLISGWVTQAEAAILPDDLADEVGPEVVVQQVSASADDDPPVLMKNKAPARPFQFLVGLLGLPRYGTFDPTWLMALFMPFFFGLMLGDVAYGAALLIIAFIVYRVFRDRSALVRDLSIVLMMSAGWAIVWGFIYGEFLGNLGREGFGMEPLWIDREEAIEPLLLFALAIGAAHVVLSLVLGGVQAVRSRKPRVLTERLAMLVALVGLFLIAGVAADQLPSGVMPPAVGAVVVGLAVLMAIGGAMGIFMGPLELLGTVGNVLSYLRLAAIGLASVYLARVANELGSAAPLLIGIVVAALFHALNLALGAFSPTIQSLRLHYVEFFNKFHEPGGEPFSAFGATESQSERIAG
jgi:V/A-type H+-transporting ATPase subunit I